MASAENLETLAARRLLPVVPLIKATALALAKCRCSMGSGSRDELQAQEGDQHRLCGALRTGGLVTPALFNVDAKSVTNRGRPERLIRRMRRSTAIRN